MIKLCTVQACTHEYSKNSLHYIYDKNSRPFSYSKKESELNDIYVHFVEFSNVNNAMVITATTPFNQTLCLNMYKNIA